MCDSCLETRFFAPARSLSAAEPDPLRCSTCGRPLISAEGECTDCRKLPIFTACDRVLPLFPYDPEARELLSLWKMAGLRTLSAVWAACAAAALAGDTRSTGAVLVPVPPRPGKIREKGWDQIEELASILEKRYGLAVCRCLERSSAAQQKRLGKTARAENIRGRIRVKPGATVPASAIVLDDLMTTGATLEACASALREAGCAPVRALTLFYD